MTLADARALEPAVKPADADFMADARALDGLADWCGRYTPWVGLDAPDGIFLDITGCAHLFGGEAALVEDVAGRLEDFGYRTRAAIADTPGAAWAMARHGAERYVNGAERCVIVRPGHGRQALAGLPVEGLRLPAEIAAGLRRVGMRRIGDLYAMPRAGITARFGVIVTRRLDLALAISPEPISPRRPVPPHIARAAFAEPISTPENLTAATRHLLDATVRRAGTGGAGGEAARSGVLPGRWPGRTAPPSGPAARCGLPSISPVCSPGSWTGGTRPRRRNHDPRRHSRTARSGADRDANRRSRQLSLLGGSGRMRPNWSTGWATASACPGAAAAAAGKRWPENNVEDRPAAHAGPGQAADPGRPTVSVPSVCCRVPSPSTSWPRCRTIRR